MYYDIVRYNPYEKTIYIKDKKCHLFRITPKKFPTPDEIKDKADKMYIEGTDYAALNFTKLDNFHSCITCKHNCDWHCICMPPQVTVVGFQPGLLANTPPSPLFGSSHPRVGEATFPCAQYKNMY